MRTLLTGDARVVFYCNSICIRENLIIGDALGSYLRIPESRGFKKLHSAGVSRGCVPDDEPTSVSDSVVRIIGYSLGGGARALSGVIP